MWLGQQVSSLERCPLFRVSLIERFHCTYVHMYVHTYVLYICSRVQIIFEFIPGHINCLFVRTYVYCFYILASHCLSFLIVPVSLINFIAAH